MVSLFVNALSEIYDKGNLALNAHIIKGATATDHEMRELIMKRNVLQRQVDK